MLTQIDVLSDQAFELPILGVTPKTSLMVQKVTGLNPPDRDLFIGDYSQDGGIYQGRRVGKRNVVFLIKLNPNPALGETVQILRERLYKAFIDPQIEGDYLKILFHDDFNRQIYTVGYCEKFEGEIFDADTLCSISMICPDPYLRDNQDSIVTSPTGFVQVPFTYQGTAETGFIVRIMVTAPTTAITLYNNGKVMQLVNTATGYQTGDLIVINTVPGQRSISLTKPADYSGNLTEYDPAASYTAGDLIYYVDGIWRALVNIPSNSVAPTPDGPNTYWQSVSTPIVSHLLSTSQWLSLHSVENTMRVYEGNVFTNVVANIRYLRYTAAYWGL